MRNNTSYFGHLHDHWRRKTVGTDESECNFPAAKHQRKRKEPAGRFSPQAWSCTRAVWKSNLERHGIRPSRYMQWYAAECKLQDQRNLRIRSGQSFVCFAFRKSELQRCKMGITAINANNAEMLHLILLNNNAAFMQWARYMPSLNFSSPLLCLRL